MPTIRNILKMKKIVDYLPHVSSSTQASLIRNRVLGGSRGLGSFGSIDTPKEIIE